MSIGVSRLDRVAGPVRYWWLFVVSGVLWILFSLLVLQLNLGSVRAIGFLLGFVLLIASFEEIAAGIWVPGWKWLRFVMGGLILIGGVAALTWPGATTLVLARILGWYLLFKGLFGVVFSLADRTTEYWWLTLVTGFVEIALAFWVVGYPGRSLTLLLLWIGFSSLTRGTVQLVVGFQLRSALAQVTDK